MNDRKRTSLAVFLTLAAATSLLVATSMQAAHAANPLQPSFYQWPATAPMSLGAMAAELILREQQNPLSPAYEFRGDLVWKPAGKSVYQGQTHPLHPSFNRPGAT